MEVKYRSSRSFGDPALAVTPAKLQKIVKTAKHFMLVRKIPIETTCSIDVISITGDLIEHYKNVTGY